MNKIYFFLFLVFLFAQTFAQKTQLQIGTQIPLNYAFGIEHSFAEDKFSANLQVGYLTKPYDIAILEILKLLGTEEAIVNTIGDAAMYGVVFQPTFKYHFRTFYTGLTYSLYTLKAKEVPSEAIENYYGTSIPNRRDRILNLQSNIHNIGLLIGKQFPFGENRNSGLKVEFSIQKSFTSSSKLYANGNNDFTRLNTQISDELNQYYVDYGYLPSINVFYYFRIQ